MNLSNIFTTVIKCHIKLLILLLTFNLYAQTTLKIRRLSPKELLAKKLSEKFVTKESINQDNIELLNKFSHSSPKGDYSLAVELYNYFENNKLLHCMKITSGNFNLDLSAQDCFKVAALDDFKVQKGNMILYYSDSDQGKVSILFSKVDDLFVTNENLVEHKENQSFAAPLMHIFKEKEKSLIVLGIEHGVTGKDQTNDKQFIAVKNIFDNLDYKKKYLLLIEGHGFSHGLNYNLKKMNEYELSGDKKIKNWQALIAFYAWKLAIDNDIPIRGLEPNSDEKAGFLIHQVGLKEIDYARYFMTGEKLLKGLPFKDNIDFFNQLHTEYQIENNRDMRTYFEKNMLKEYAFERITYSEALFRDKFFINVIADQLNDEQYDTIIVIYGIYHLESEFSTLMNMINIAN